MKTLFFTILSLNLSAQTIVGIGHVDSTITIQVNFTQDTVNIGALLFDMKGATPKAYKLITKYKNGKPYEQWLEDLYNPSNRPKFWKERMVWYNTLKKMGME